MNPVYYDLHLHSCLSPCGDLDMTPYNLVNMAKLKGLDIIALTDHNTCGNCPAAIEAAKAAGICLLPGMELTTEEEIHVVCLFPSLDAAMAFDAYTYERLMDVENRPDIFGEQLLMDARDLVLGSIRKLLVGAVSIGISSVPSLVDSFGGICYPAHIDRPSYSVLSSLGFLPPECGFAAVEVHDPGAFFADNAHPEIAEAYRIITSSDAHRLEEIAEQEHAVPMEVPGFAGLAEYICRKGAFHGI